MCTLIYFIRSIKIDFSTSKFMRKTGQWMRYTVGSVHLDIKWLKCQHLVWLRNKQKLTRYHNQNIMNECHLISLKLKQMITSKRAKETVKKSNKSWHSRRFLLLFAQFTFKTIARGTYSEFDQLELVLKTTNNTEKYTIPIAWIKQPAISRRIASHHK